MSELRTDYVNDELAISMGGKRRYRMIENSDGTVSFEDVTSYSVVGDEYGADDINSQNETINQISNDLLTKADKNNVPNFNTTPIHTMNNVNGAVTYTPAVNCLVVCTLSAVTGIDPNTGQPSQSANKQSTATVTRNNVVVAEHSVGENFYAIPYQGSITTSFECKAGDVISLNAVQGLASTVKFYKLT